MNNRYFLLVLCGLLRFCPASVQTTDLLRLNQVFANIDESQVPTSSFYKG